MLSVLIWRLASSANAVATGSIFDGGSAPAPRIEQEADLDEFLPENLTLRIRRLREFPEDLGLAGGSVRVENVKEGAFALGG